MWQWLFLSWLNPLLEAGSTTALQDEMLPNLLPADTPEANALEAKVVWEAELQAHSPGGLVDLEEAKASGASLWMVLFRMYRGMFFLSGFLTLLNLAATFAPPLLLNALLKYIEHEDGQDQGVAYGYTLAALMCVLQFATGLLNNHSNVIMVRLGTRSRAALTTLVYGKTLKLSQAARAEFSHGQIKNMMQIDAGRLANSSGLLHATWSTPLTFGICLWMLYAQIGPAAFSGIGVIILLAPCNGLVMKYIFQFTRAIQTNRDKRVKLLGEVLSGIKIVKSLGWEPELKTQVDASREAEMQEIGNFQYLIVCIQLLWSICPTLISVSSFAIYTLLDNELTAAKAFTALSLFNILTGPVQVMPMVVMAISEVSVSMERIRSFMLAEEAIPEP